MINIMRIYTYKNKSFQIVQWGDNGVAEYEDNLGLNEACQEWYETTIGVK